MFSPPNSPAPTEPMLVPDSTLVVTADFFEEHDKENRNRRVTFAESPPEIIMIERIGKRSVRKQHRSSFYRDATPNPVFDSSAMMVFDESRDEESFVQSHSMPRAPIVTPLPHTHSKRTHRRTKSARFAFYGKQQEGSATNEDGVVLMDDLGQELQGIKLQSRMTMSEVSPISHTQKRRGAISHGRPTKKVRTSDYRNEKVARTA